MFFKHNREPGKFGYVSVKVPESVAQYGIKQLNNVFSILCVDVQNAFKQKIIFVIGFFVLLV